MRLCAITDLICRLILIMAIGLTVELLALHSGFPAILILLAVMLLCVVFLACSAKRIHALSKHLAPYCVPLGNVTLSSLISAFGASEMGNGGYVAFSRIGRYHFRLVLQHTPQFDREEISRARKTLNKKINAQYRLQTKMSLWDAYSLIRINLVVCQQRSDELLETMHGNMETLLSRNEVIIPAAIVLDSGELFFPDCMARLTPNQLNRYIAAAQYLYNTLV